VFMIKQVPHEYAKKNIRHVSYIMIWKHQKEEKTVKVFHLMIKIKNAFISMK
jgi:hypothetical protein